MKTVVVYSSKYGTTYSIANHISLALNSEIYSVNEFQSKDISDYHTVILGSPIYNGGLLDEMDVFCRDNLDALTSVNLALFVSCMTKNDYKQHRQLKHAYLKPLHKHARCVVGVGGAINFNKLSAADKLLSQSIGFDSSVTAIDQVAIEKLIRSVQASS